MNDSTQRERGVEARRDPVGRIDGALYDALDHVEDPEGRYHIRQALQFVEAVRQPDR